MGLVRFTSRRTGEELEAEFPLHPGLVNATRADGSTVQLMRDVWDQEYTQKLPELPAVSADNIPPDREQTTQPYEAPQVIQLAKPEKVPTSHAAWFSLLWDELVAIERKIDQVIAELKPRDVEQIETTPAPAEPPTQG